MASESEKAIIELNVFQKFIGKTRLPVRYDSISKPGTESEPDIFCTIRHEKLAFELVEICASDIAENLSGSPTKLDKPKLLSGDPTERIVLNKLRKSYRTKLPIELLCYTNARVCSTDEQIISEIRRCANGLAGPFRKIWLMGDLEVYEVWPEIY